MTVSSAANTVPAAAPSTGSAGSPPIAIGRNPPDKSAGGTSAPSHPRRIAATMSWMQDGVRRTGGKGRFMESIADFPDTDFRAPTFRVSSA